MTNNYFAVERDGKCIEDLVLRDENGDIAFENIMNMSYEEVRQNTQEVQEFIVTIMDATNMYFGSIEDENTVVTLIGPDDVFIWGIIMGPENDELKYVFIDWQKDCQKFKYEKENEDFFEKGIDKVN